MKYLVVTRPEGDHDHTVGYAVETPAGAVLVVWGRASDDRRWAFCADREAVQEVVGELEFREVSDASGGSCPIRERLSAGAINALKEAAIVTCALGEPLPLQALTEIADSIVRLQMREPTD